MPIQPRRIEVPILETERLRLRGHRLDDFLHSAAMWADPAVTLHITGRPFTEEESWARFLRYVGHWSLIGFGYWLAEDRDTGQFLGEIGFADYKRDLEPSLSGIPEIGWAFISRAHGRGYATEAVRAAVGWGDANFPSIPALGCDTDRGQIFGSDDAGRSCREFQQTTYKGQPTTMFVRDRRTL